jgi:hypothetical protein
VHRYLRSAWPSHGTKVWQQVAEVGALLHWNVEGALKVPHTSEGEISSVSAPCIVRSTHLCHAWLYGTYLVRIFLAFFTLVFFTSGQRFFSVFDHIEMVAS